MGENAAKTNIRSLDLTDTATVREILSVQNAAYRNEARLIGFSKIPALKDTEQTIRVSEESFYGYRIGNRLAGVVSTRSEGDTVEICRLVTRPGYLRRGVAGHLLDYIEQGLPTGQRMRVSTAAANAPALSLYTKRGFSQISRHFAKEGVELITLEKPHQRDSRGRC